MMTQNNHVRNVTIPWIGKDYSTLIGDSLRRLGLEVRLPPRTTDKTIQIGVRHSAEMMCFPYKPTLGNFVESLDNGANTLLMYDSGGQCRLKHYWKLHEFALREMGYKFEMYNINFCNVFRVIKHISGTSSVRILKEAFYLYNRIREVDQLKKAWSETQPNIGIIGEIFTCCDERINFGIEEKIEQLGAKPVNTVTLSSFIKESFFKRVRYPGGKSKYFKAAETYLNGELGGHGKENIAHLLELIDHNIGGVIHLLPMSCMPETTIEPFITAICRAHNVPLLRIPIDENTAEANLDTRLETFVELIKMREQP